MRIIKHGTPPVPPVTVRFECRKCKCVFEAGVEDLKQSDFNDDYFVCKCPECGMENGEMISDMPGKAATVRSQAYFHGENWYVCSKCGKGFEYWDAYYKDCHCPHCKQKVRFRS